MNISIWNNLPLCLNIKNEAWQAGFLHSHNLKKKIQQHQKCLGCFCGFSGHMRLGLWTFVSCCTLQWAGALVYPWFGADMTFVANGLIQLKW